MRRCRTPAPRARARRRAARRQPGARGRDVARRAHDPQRPRGWRWGSRSPSAALLGFAAVSAGALLPYGPAFAAAAMIHVVVDELLPERFARGNQRVATLGPLAGFLLMTALDNAWG